MGWWMEKLAEQQHRRLPPKRPGWTEPKTDPVNPQPQPELPGEDQVVIDKSLTLDEYLDRVRPEMTGKQAARPVTARERFAGSIEYTRADGVKASVPQRDSSDITVRQGNRTWETNSWGVKTDRGIFGDATPQEMAAAYQQMVRDGRFNETNVAAARSNAAVIKQGEKAGVWDSSNARQPATRFAPSKDPRPGW